MLVRIHKKQEAVREAEDTAGAAPGSEAEASQAISDDTDEGLWDEVAESFNDEDEVSDEGQEVEATAEAEPAAGTEEVPAAESEAEATTAATVPESSETQTPTATEATPEAAKAEAEKPKEEAKPAEDIQPEPQMSRDEWLEKIVPALETRYQLSDDDAASMVTEPEKVIPRLAARLHAEIFENVVQAIGSSMPMVLDNIQRQRQGEDAAKAAFLEAWPELNDEDGIKMATRLMPVYLQNYPNAKLDEVIQEVGATAMITLRRARAAEQQQQQQQTDTGGGIPRNELTEQKPHTPAGKGSGAQTPAPAISDNDFTQIAEEFLQDDKQ